MMMHGLTNFKFGITISVNAGFKGHSNARMEIVISLATVTY
jgi:hypothetical protein